jgi:alkanesulfonate monooxygenase SsuD/methylene tetrahydromethanopterin reductase-like flavin-dependent oxidoreductase (luciferase family)
MRLALQQAVNVAESVAPLDVTCGGRLVFGVGLGAATQRAHSARRISQR